MDSLASNVIEFAKKATTRVARKLETGQEIGPLDQVHVTREINRTWQRHCTPTEIALLYYIIDRTLGWGKATFKASTENILEGDETYAGLCLSERVFHRTKKDLADKGMIVHRRSRDYTVLGLNFDWSEEMLPIPKRLKTPQNCQSDSSRTANLAPQNCQFGRQKSKSEKSKTIIPSPSARDEFDEDILPGEKRTGDDPANLTRVNFEDCNGLQGSLDGFDVKARVEAQLAQTQDRIETTRQNRVRKAETKHGSQLNTTDLELIWKQALHETFPEHMHVAWTADQKKRIKPFITRFVTSVHGDLLAFARWSVLNWRVVLKRNPWMDNAPEFPAVNWWMSSGVQSVFARSRAEIAERRFETPAMQDEYTRLLRSGMTEEEAHHEMARRKEHEVLQAQMKQTRDEANRKLAQARDLEDRAARMEGLEEKLASNPDLAGLIRRDGQGRVVVPHPNSQRMQALREEARRAERDAIVAAAPKTTTQTPSIPAETWEQMQDRLRQQRLNGGKA